MSEKKKPNYHIEWPEGAEIKMHPQHLEEIKKSLETQFKTMIYKQPGFKFFPCLGNTNFFQHFRTHDGIDFGVCHLYWDKNAVSDVDYIDSDGNVEQHKGGWRIRWLPAGCYDVVGEPSPVSEKGWKLIHQAIAKKVASCAKKQIQEQQRQQEVLNADDDEEEEEKPPKYLN